MSQKVPAFSGCHERFDMASICHTIAPFHNFYSKLEAGGPDYVNDQKILSIADTYFHPKTVLRHIFSFICQKKKRCMNSSTFIDDATFDLHPFL